jgi:aminomethyltransferase
MGEYAGVTMRDTTLETVMIAVQGPKAAETMDGLLRRPDAPTTLRLFSLADGEVALDADTPQTTTPVMVSRTGYTGEDGFEVFADAAAGQAIWRLLLDHGASSCGLGARDTLRLEAGLALHGNDIDAATTPLEAGLDRFVALDQDGDFVGKEALLRQREAGLRRRLVGFIMQEKALPRHGYAILAGGRQIGTVTSGGYSPSLDRGIGMGYVPVEHEALGTALEIDLRGRPSPAQVVQLPFYKRP